jgi:hypothetical protein
MKNGKNYAILNTKVGPSSQTSAPRHQHRTLSPLLPPRCPTALPTLEAEGAMNWKPAIVYAEQLVALGSDDL